MRLKAASFLLVLFLAGVCVAQAPPKTTLGLMDFSCSGFSRNEGRLLNDRLLLEVANTDKFEVIERSKRDELLKEHGFAQTGFCDQTTCLIEAGKYLAVQKMVGGSVGKFGTTWTVNIRMVDVNTGKVEKTSIRDFKGEMDGLLAMMKDVAREITQIPVITPDQETLRQKHIADSLETLAEAQRKAELVRQQKEEEQRLTAKKMEEHLAVKQKYPKPIVKSHPKSSIFCFGVSAGVGKMRYRDYGFVMGVNAGTNSWSPMDIELSGFKYGVKAGDVSFSLLCLVSTVKLKLTHAGSAFTPYIGAGPGLYIPKWKYSTVMFNGSVVENSGSDNEFGLDGVGGVDLNISNSPLCVGAQARYGVIFSSGSSDYLLAFLGVVKFHF